MLCLPVTLCCNLRIKKRIRGTKMNVKSEIELLRRDLLNEVQVEGD